MIDRPRNTFQLASNNIFGDVTGHVDGIRTQSANHAVRNAKRSGQYKEFVVALQAIDLNHFNRRVAHIEASAENTVFGNDNIVSELSTENDHLIKACAAFNRNGCIDIVAYFVLTTTGTNIRRLCDRKSKSDLRRRHTVLIQYDDIIGRILSDSQIQEVDATIAIGIKDRIA